MNLQSQASPKSVCMPVESPCPTEVTFDPFQMVVDAKHGSYCRSVESDVRERIHREEEQERLEAFMRAAIAD